ncbi:MAG: hypothetical protein K2J32_09135 [Ruminococcus sp.]|nr:hypothetical protein [Ruminococcus sp.]
MKKLICLLFLAMTIVSCSETTENSGTSSQAETIQTVTEYAQDGTVAPVEVVEEGMTPVYADALKDGVYPVEVSSSSSMFKITECELTIQNGTMSAEMTMSGTGYKWLFMGNGETAENASESDYIPFVEEDGVHKFTVPVEALDMGIECTAFSFNKEKWYDRTILFRADSLPVEAFADGAANTIESLGITDGEYTVEVTLEGGSGKAGIYPHTQMTVKDGKATARIIWTSSNYDYMVIDGKKYMPLEDIENSAFDIPVDIFDMKMSVSADTTAMSTPHEIDYTLYFDSSTIAK